MRHGPLMARGAAGTSRQRARGWLALGLLWLAACSPAQPLRTTPPLPPPLGATFRLAPDGVRLYAAVEGEGRGGVVWLVLGPEAGSRPPYPRLTAALQAAGLATAVLHLRGSGLSDGPRGDTPDYPRLLEDQRAFARDLSGRFAGRPLFLLGHSAGAALALEVAASGAAPIAGLVLVNPACRLRDAPGLSPTLGDYLRFGADYLLRPSALTVDMNARPEAVLDPDDRAEGLALRGDPLVVRHFSLRYLAAQRAVMQRCAANAGKVTAPLLLVEGARDAMVDPAGSAEILRAAAGADKRRLPSPGAHGSSAVEEAVEPLLAWLLAHQR